MLQLCYDSLSLFLVKVPLTIILIALLWVKFFAKSKNIVLLLWVLKVSLGKRKIIIMRADLT